MATLVVCVTPECEGLIHSLPRGREWELLSEEYALDGSGLIKIGFSGDDIDAATEEALNSHDEVTTWRIEP